MSANGPPRTSRPSLPVDAVLPELVAELEAGRDVVLEATPGAGKTTRVPPALLAARFAEGKEILVLEPRRLAAKMAAHRVAAELGEAIGRTVGYQFRFESVGGPSTRIRFLTEGLFVRRLLSDPQLKRVAAVVIDEFHERHLQGDVALASLKRLKQTTRPDLRLVVMSATLDVGGISSYLRDDRSSRDARVISVEARRFDVAVEYLELGDEYLDKKVATAVKRTGENDGDVLVFLPGVAEIRRAATALESWAETHGAVLLPLYGDLSREEQERALGPAERRKVILSTNVAETSLTIDGVRVVVDGGLARVASHSHWSGLPALRTRPISRASAVQRAGRAGRTAPGRCLRLYGKHDFEMRAPYDTPEIRRSDLTQTVLELHVLGVANPNELPWFEAPLPAALEAASSLLFRLGAVDSDGRLTTLGRRMAEIPVHPRLARLVLEGERLGRAREACVLAAMLSERTSAEAGGGLDVMAALERYRPVGTATRVVDQCLRHCREAGAAGPSVKPLPPDSKNGDARPGGPQPATSAPAKTTPAKPAPLARAVLAAFPDRVAKRRELAANVARNTSGRKVELVLSSGSVMLEDAAVSAVGPAEYVVTIDIEERGKSGRVCRSLCAIEPEWLFDVEPEGVREATEVTWDAARERATSSVQMVYDGLVLAETKGEGDPGEIARVLASEAVSAGLERFCDKEQLQSLIERMKLVRERLPDPTLPVLNEAGLRELVTQLCVGRKSFAELRQADLVQQLLGGMAPDARAKLETLAPEHVALSRGRRVRVHYEAGREPWIESRLQDFFGMRTGPAILKGRVPLVLHLLAPNARAVQVTSDLSGFWRRVYPDLRRELGRRYPRHAWPEDPLAN